VSSLPSECNTHEASASRQFRLFEEKSGNAVTQTAKLCADCRDGCVAALAYQYRAAIPSEQLPPALSARPDCWHGRACRTQRHNSSHAARFNHICEPKNSRAGGRA